jgi:methylmalonyl-CoA/ethylmalonyl-CoA epimerase
MITKVSHVGVAVQNLEETLNFLRQAFDLEPSKKVQTPALKAAFVHIAKGEIELLEPTDPKSPMAKFIAERGEGVHHVSFEVENIEDVLRQLKMKGIQMIDEKPRIGVHGVKVAFLDPKSTKGIFIELCEKEE